MGTLLQNELDPETNKLEFQRLALTATFFAGVAQTTFQRHRNSGCFPADLKTQQNVKAVFDTAIKVVLQPPRMKEIAR
ncbi:hypothetical protein ACET3Z_029124 [Daucus carota]